MTITPWMTAKLDNGDTIEVSKPIWSKHNHNAKIYNIEKGESVNGTLCSTLHNT